MLSVSLDSSGSPRKRTISRGLSEDESLRSIISENENSSRRLTRSDSRTLRKRTDSQQSDKDLLMGLPGEMLELQASYDEVVQELRGLEVEREALLFQVDVLQDTLESIEELLAEAHREAGQANSALQQEKDAKKKLENMVCSLTKEVEELKEERKKTLASMNSNETQVDSARKTPTSKDDAEEQKKGTNTEENNSSVCEGQGSEGRGSIVNKPLGHFPSLVLDNPLSGDGVLWRPCENGIDHSRDSSPDRNDSDNISAYEDACAETPDQDRVFPSDGDTVDLPDDVCQEEASRNPDACVVS
ncbi:myosin-4 [Cynoglossus semilaevis]|uniref:myosin-4 n=1 Tax=Cynoglossus semilaevis TaxID=244447 RepID=UPI000497733A|nr:myosin-4-like [Cynoglossus semilaevis]